ncbi:MAG: hypothetical protein JO146_03585 [Candidatus Eremiobacteraeota bacterium]|nr:hypothetical protein [Candidatus Eremiobacteraeota bacterium]
MVGCATNGNVAPVTPQQQPQVRVPSGPGWVYKDGVLYHQPHYMVTRNAAVKPPSISLTYYGGPVQTTPAVYIIFWGYQTYGDRQGVQNLLTTYMTNMGGSGHNNIYTQYYGVVGSNTTYISNPTGQLLGVWNDQTNKVPLHPTDSQVAAEALHGVTHFGYNGNASYIVATPHGRSTSGFRTQWCAYHSNTFTNGNLVSYTNLPYIPDAGSACGSNIISPPSDETGADEGVTIVGGHEQGESVTDPQPNTGWYNTSYGEIGDICAWTNIQNDPFGSYSYTSQPMFSNATHSCVHSY